MGFEERKIKRIEQLRACALGIAEDAEEIYGDYGSTQNVTVTISMKCNEYPQVTVERQYVTNKFLEYLTKD